MWDGWRIRLAVLPAGLLIVGLVLVAGCGAFGDGSTRSGPSALDRASSSSRPVAGSSDPEVVIAEAGAQVEALLGLPEGEVAQSDATWGVATHEVTLSWGDQGMALVDLDVGRITAIMPERGTAGVGPRLSGKDLDARALEVVRLLGWDDEALMAEGFVREPGQIVPGVVPPTVWSSSWSGHDEAGLPNQGLIEVSLDATTGELLRYFYFPGPTGSLDALEAISRDDAVRIAKDYIGETPQIPTYDTAAPGSTATKPEGVVVKSAVLVHSDAPAVTGGGEMLVWIVKLGGRVPGGLVSATVYIDALTGEVLIDIVGS